MATAVTSNQLLTKVALRVFKFDPDATSETEISWVAMRDFANFAATFARTVGTSAVTFAINCATDSSGTGSVAVLAHAVGSEPDAIDDQIHLEVTHEQIREVLATATHVSAIVSVATGTDEGSIVYQRGGAKHIVDGLTADIVA